MDEENPTFETGPDEQSEGPVSASPDNLTPPERVTLSNGIVLKVRPVNAAVQNRAALSIPLPPVPTVAGAHGVEEENPNDPDYIDACAVVAGKRLDKVGDALYTLGSTVEFVPEGMYPPEDDGWIEELAAVGIELPDYSAAPATLLGVARGRVARYRDWLKLYALATYQDGQHLWNAVVARSMVLEAEVLAAVAMFRRGAERHADNGLSAAPDGGDGDRVPPADTGDDSGIRAEASGVS